MRISTLQIYQRGVNAIDTQQSALSRTQQQIALGKRIGTPSDDPIGAAQSLTLNQAKDRIAQYSSNIDAAKDALAQDDSVLGQVTDLLQSVRTLALNGGNSGLNDKDRASLATEASGRLQQLLGLVNLQDGDGRYLFSGFAANTQPFVTAPSGAITYNGDQGQRTLDVAPGRTVPIAYNGSAVFEAVRTGNGSFSALAGSTNAGTGVIGGATVTNPSLLPGDTYRLQFSVSGGVTTYDVIDTTTSTTVSSGNPFTSGATISVAGMQVSVAGAPAAGDQFTLAPSATQSVFQTLQNLIATLNTPAIGTAGVTRLQNDLNRGVLDIDQALDHVLSTRADAGATLRELDALSTGNDDRNLQLDTSLSRLNDLDYNKALSDYARQQLSLDAAQKSFAKVSGLSLFDYL
jgi:flagellar hook-associated protein 3 FlgL